MKSTFPRIIRFVLCFALLATGISISHAKELVGSLPGQLSVRQGAAVYTVPIEAPPGVAPRKWPIRSPVLPLPLQQQWR